MIQVDSLTKYYGRYLALYDVSFHISPGEIVGILGPNGAGKTTLINILSCLQIPSSGSALVGGFDVVSSSVEVKNMVGFLPEVPPLYNEMTVESYLFFSARIRGFSASQAKERLDAICGATNISTVRSQLIGTLSHGFRQRTGIAQAVIHNPQVLILDEPGLGLDPVQLVEMRQMIIGLRKKHTIVVSSHLLSEISQIADRIFLLKDGRLVAQGSEAELSKRMGRGRSLLLVVRGAEEDFESQIREIPGVVEVAGQESAAKDPAESSFRITSDRDIRPQLANKVVSSGLELLELSPAEHELERIFMSMAQTGAETTG